jgi:hypothetical protein
MRWCVILPVLLFQVGCDRDSYLKFAGYDRASLMKKNTPQDDEALAIGSIELLRQKRFEQVEERLDPSIRNADLRSRLVAMAEMFPTREPSSIKTVDASHPKGSSTTSITLEYEFPPSATTEVGFSLRFSFGRTSKRLLDFLSGQFRSRSRFTTSSPFSTKAFPNMQVCFSLF